MTKRSRYYILVSDWRTWKTSFTKNIFGFRKSTYGLWNKSDKGDFLAFYVTSPTMKIIGFGKITDKFIDEEPFWPEEKSFEKSIWKYKIEFKVFSMTKNWENGIEPPANLMLNTGRKVIDKDTFSSLVKIAEKKWRTEILKKIF